MSTKPAPPSLASWTMQPTFTVEDRGVCCSICGRGPTAGNQTPILRGTHVDLEGFFSTCWNCAVQGGKLAGLVDPDEMDRLSADLVIEKQTVKDQAKALRSAQKRIDALMLLLHGDNEDDDTDEGDE